jgi:DNA polymerase III delta prime subunit
VEVLVSEVVVNGTIGGTTELYVRLDAPSQAKLGKRSLAGPAMGTYLESEGFQKGNEVVCLMTDDGKLKLVVKAEDYVIGTSETSETLTDEEIAEVVSQVVTRQTVDELLESFEPAVTAPDGMFHVPDADPFYIMNGELALVLEKMLAVAKAEGRMNLLLTGPASTGKTTLASIIAAKLGYELATTAVGDIVESTQWTATVFAASGSTRVVPSHFAYGIVQPRTVTLLDEVNRTHPKNHNGCYDLLDERGRKYVDLLETELVRAPDTIVIATANVEETNVGVFPMDSAFIDRFPFQLRLEYPSRVVQASIIKARSGIEEQFADLLAELAGECHKLVGSSLLHSVGNRQLIAAAKLMLRGLHWTRACTCTVAMAFSHEGGANSNRAVVLNLIQGLSGKAPRRKARTAVGK